MKHSYRGGVLLALVLVLLLALGVAPALATDSSASVVAVPSVVPSSPASTAGLAPLGPCTVVGIDSPLSVARYDFSRDPEYYPATEHFIGDFYGIEWVGVVGNTIAASPWWNPNPVPWWPLGKHAAITLNGVSGIYITFDQPQVFAGVSAIPNNGVSWVDDEWVPNYYDVKITAYDRMGYNIGSYTVNMSTYFGIRFIGLLSFKQNIAAIEITTEAEASGLLLTDLAYGPGRMGKRGH